VFKEKGGELTFAKAIQIANEIEKATKVAKETVKSNADDSYAVNKTQMTRKPFGRTVYNKTVKSDVKANNNSAKLCGRCGKAGHTGPKCKFKTYVCNYCKKVGHIERACLKKRKDRESVQTISLVKSTPQLKQTLCLNGQEITFEVDTGAGDSFLSKNSWFKIGKPELQASDKKYESASGLYLSSVS